MHNIPLEKLLASTYPPRIPGCQQNNIEIPDLKFIPFSLLKPDTSNWQTFNAMRHTKDIAGMLRHAIAAETKRQGWSNQKINQIVHGKTPEGNAPISGNMISIRFSYLPLPTIYTNDHSIHSIRRVLVCAPTALAQEINHFSKQLPGLSLIDEKTGKKTASLSLLMASDSILKHYIDEAQEWATATPMILPGYDDVKRLSKENGPDSLLQKDAKIESLIRKSFRHAGFSDSLMSQTQLEWSKVGFIKGSKHVSSYLPPQNLNNAPRYHVRIFFPHSVSGPIAIGSGRFRGFGIFAHFEKQQ